MKSHFLCLVFCILALSGFSQYSIGDYYQTFNDPNRSRNIPIHIFYPATSTGTNAPAAAGSFPIISFGHGFIISYSQYQWLADALVPLGYIVAFPDTETGIPPDHLDFGLDVAFAVDAIVSEGLSTNSNLYNIVGNSSAIGGHSMGGGASFLGAEGNTSLSALFNFAAAETNPSAIAAASNITIPTLIIEGSDDCVTPSSGNTLDMYNALASNCKSLYTINGGSHCKFANSDFLCGFGEIGCGGSLSLSAQEAFTLDILIPFLNYHLMDDCTEGGNLESLFLNPSPNSVQSTCNYSMPPTVSISGLPSSTSSAMPITLSSNLSGGTFSGSGITGNTFDPSTAGSGLHNITYSINSNACIVSDSQNIFVFTVAYNFATYTSETISP